MARELRIRLLGEIEVVHDGQPQPLPASKKTRALLGYLAANPRLHTRPSLCELLWDGPDDPRAALRWSLSKLRQVVDADVVRLQGDREHVQLVVGPDEVDLAAAQQAAGAQPASATVDSLRQAAAYLRGELLDGLDMEDCLHFQTWLIGERVRARKLRLAVLDALVSRLGGEPEAALEVARSRLSIDPLAESAHAAVIRLLGETGRRDEGLQQYDVCRRLLERHLSVRPSMVLEQARLGLQRTQGPAPTVTVESLPPVESTPPAWRRQEQRGSLVGRTHEQARLIGHLEQACAEQASGLVLLVGEPGIGKTRLLEELQASVRGRGGLVIAGRAFEAELVRPYGPWIDGVRGLGSQIAVEPALAAEVGALWPELRPPGSDATTLATSRLFDAAVRLVMALTASSPVAMLALDDLQWFDEASANLLHFAVRALSKTRILLAGSARAGELEANGPTIRVMRALRREGLLHEIALGPLSAKETEELAGAGGPIDVGRVIAQSGGNPLFALELAGALRRGEDALPTSLGDMIADRLGHLDASARDMLPWAAALGRRFDPDTLARVSGCPMTTLIGALDDLERRGVLRPSGTGAGAYDFAHDLVRQVAYLRLSEPRRRLVHLHVARMLAAEADPEGALAAEVAHHAGLGGDGSLAAQAALTASDRCLRMCARAEAAEIARRAIPLARALPNPAGFRLAIALHRRLSYAQVGRSRLMKVSQVAELKELAAVAGAAGDSVAVATAHHCLALFHFELGDEISAHQDTLASADAAREADPKKAAFAMANTGRCLAHIERDIEQALMLLDEAEAMAGDQASQLPDIGLGRGMALEFNGQRDAALAAYRRGLEAAQRLEDHWPAFHALYHIVVLLLEDHRPAEARGHLATLDQLAARLEEGSERPITEVLGALVDRAEGHPGEHLEAAMARLREADARATLSQLEGLAAHMALERGRLDEAQSRAEAAIEHARVIGRPSSRVAAHALMSNVCSALGNRVAAQAHFAEAQALLESSRDVSARAQEAVARAQRALDVPTVVPTLEPTQARHAQT